MDREQSFRLEDLRALAHELDRQDREEKRNGSSSSTQDMEYVAPPTTGLYSSKSKGLSRDNLPRRLQQKNSNRRTGSPVPGSGHSSNRGSSGHSVRSVGSDNHSSYHSSNNSSMNGSMGHHSFAGHDSFAGGNDSNSSATGFDFNHSAPATMNHSHSPTRGTDIPASMGIITSSKSLNGDKTKGLPPSLRRAHTGGGNGNPRRTRGLAGKRSYRGAGASLHRLGTDDSIRSTQSSQSSGSGNPFHHRTNSDDAGSSISSRQRPAGSRGRSPIRDAMPSWKGEIEPRNGRVPLSQGMGQSSFPEVNASNNEEDEMGGSMISDPGPIRPRGDENFSRRRNERQFLNSIKNRSPANSGRSLLSAISSNDGDSSLNKSDHSDSNVAKAAALDSSDSNVPMPALASRNNKGLSANPTNSADVTRLEPAKRRTTVASSSNSGKQVAKPTMRRNQTADIGVISSTAVPASMTSRAKRSPGTTPAAPPLSFRATKGLSNAASSQMTRLELPSSRSIRSDSPMPDGRAGNHKYHIDDDVDGLEDNTMDQMDFVEGSVEPARSSSRSPPPAAAGLGGGAKRNDVRREKFGLTELPEPTDIEAAMAYAGKGSKANIDLEPDDVTTHSTATSPTPEEEPPQVGAYRVRQPRSNQQQRPGAPVPANVSAVSSNMMDPPDMMMMPDPVGGLDQNKKKLEMTNKMKAIVVGSILAVVAIIVVVVVVATTGKKDDQPAVEGSDEMVDLVLATRAPDTDMEVYLLNLIPEATAEAIALREEVVAAGNETLAPSPLTPEEQAFDWMKEDPDFIRYSDGRLLQRFALVVLYYKTGGQEWQGQHSWLAYEQHECTWAGREIECNEDLSVLQNDDFLSGSLTALKLPKSGLQGNLPLELSLLTTLDFLDFTGNSLSGSIPTELGLMTSLTKIAMDENNLGGPIPSELGQLSKLGAFAAQENFLTGTLPDFGNLVALTELILSVNQISGAFPSEFGRMTQLNRLYLDQNSISGTLPSEIGALTNLQDLYLSKNNIQGTLPGSIGNLKQLRRLLLSKNNLSGRIPTEMAMLDEIVIFLLEYNSFSGRLPTEIGIMGTSTLRTLGINHNSFSGPIPSLARLSSLSDLRLNSNQFSSTMPADLPTTLSHIDLDINLLTGPLPSELGLMTDLTAFYAYINRITGTIPSELGLCTKLERLALDQNPLEGTIPEELTALTLLKEFNVSHTLISGEFPSSFCGIMFMDFTCSPNLCGCDKCACQS